MGNSNAGACFGRTPSDEVFLSKTREALALEMKLNQQLVERMDEFTKQKDEHLYSKEMLLSHENPDESSLMILNNRLKMTEEAIHATMKLVLISDRKIQGYNKTINHVKDNHNHGKQAKLVGKEKDMERISNSIMQTADHAQSVSETIHEIGTELEAETTAPHDITMDLKAQTEQELKEYKIRSLPTYMTPNATTVPSSSSRTRKPVRSVTGLLARNTSKMHSSIAKLTKHEETEEEEEEDDNNKEEVTQSTTATTTTTPTPTKTSHKSLKPRYSRVVAVTN